MDEKTMVSGVISNYSASSQADVISIIIHHLFNQDSTKNT